MKQTSETFLSVPGYEGLYEVSNLGNVKSLRRGIILKPGKRNGSYLKVVLCKDSNKKDFAVHRLVAMVFIPNPENLPFVNHKDENPSNNCVENLEWCTAQYNNTYGTAIKRRVKKRTGREYIEDPVKRHQHRLEVQKHYNRNNKEKSKQYYLEHKEEYLQRSRDFKKNNKDKIKEYNRRYHEKRKSRLKIDLTPSEETKFFEDRSRWFEEVSLI